MQLSTFFKDKADRLAELIACEQPSDLPIRRSAYLNLIAQAFGFKDWHVVSALQSDNATDLNRVTSLLSLRDEHLFASVRTLLNGLAKVAPHVRVTWQQAQFVIEYSAISGPMDKPSDYIMRVYSEDGQHHLGWFLSAISRGEHEKGIGALAVKLGDHAGTVAQPFHGPVNLHSPLPQRFLYRQWHCSSKEYLGPRGVLVTDWRLRLGLPRDDTRAWDKLLNREGCLPNILFRDGHALPTAEPQGLHAFWNGGGFCIAANRQAGCDELDRIHRHFDHHNVTFLWAPAPQGLKPTIGRGLYILHREALAPLLFGAHDPVEKIFFAQNVPT